MALPMSRPNKHKSGIYYLQKRVPVDLIEKAGRRAVKISLRTKDCPYQFWEGDAGVGSFAQIRGKCVFTAADCSR